MSAFGSLMLSIYDTVLKKAVGVKDASTAAVATDVALVVAVSPNTPVQIGDGTGVIGGAGRPVQVSLANTATNGTPIQVSLANTATNATPVAVTLSAPTQGATPVLTTPAMTTTGALILASAPTAKVRKIYNLQGNDYLWVVYYDGTNNVTNEATAQFAIAPGQTWEMPTWNGVPEYTGVIRGALKSGSGNVQVTQVT